MHGFEYIGSLINYCEFETVIVLVISIKASSISNKCGSIMAEPLPGRLRFFELFVANMHTLSHVVIFYGWKNLFYA